MVFRRTWILLILLSKFSIAEAQERFHVNYSKLTPVTSTHLTLLGKGVQKRRSNETIVLSCSGEHCRDYQFIYFNEDQKAFYLSRPFRILDQDVKKFVKELRETNKNLRKKRVSENTRFNRGMLGFMAIVLGGPTYAIVVDTTASLIIGGGAFVAAALTIGIISAINGPDQFHHVDFISAIFNSTYGAFNPSQTSQLTYAEGWNWSEKKPKKISYRAFERLALAAQDVDLILTTTQPTQIAYPDTDVSDLFSDKTWSKRGERDYKSLGEIVAVLDGMELELEKNGFRFIKEPKKRKHPFTFDREFASEYCLKNNVKIEAWYSNIQQMAIYYWGFFDRVEWDYPEIRGIPQYPDYKEKAYTSNKIHFTKFAH